MSIGYLEKKCQQPAETACAAYVLLAEGLPAIVEKLDAEGAQYHGANRLSNLPTISSDLACQQRNQRRDSQVKAQKESHHAENQKHDSGNPHRCKLQPRGRSFYALWDVRRVHDGREVDVLQGLPERDTFRARSSLSCW